MVDMIIKSEKRVSIPDDKSLVSKPWLKVLEVVTSFLGPIIQNTLD